MRYKTEGYGGATVYLLKKNSHVIGPIWFKPVFKGQLYILYIYVYKTYVDLYMLHIFVHTHIHTQEKMLLKDIEHQWVLLMRRKIELGRE